MEPDIRFNLQLKMPYSGSLPQMTSYDDRIGVGEFWAKDVFDYIFSKHMTPDSVKNFLNDSYNATCEAYVINEINKRFL